MMAGVRKLSTERTACGLMPIERLRYSWPVQALSCLVDLLEGLAHQQAIVIMCRADSPAV